MGHVTWNVCYNNCEMCDCEMRDEVESGKWKVESGNGWTLLMSVHLYVF